MVPAGGYLPALQTWCTENGVVMIADEIQSGMARTGRYFASEHFGWEPDLVLSAKGIAGGLPLAAVTGRAEIMDSAQPGGLGGTFGGNPVACAASIAVFETIERDGLLAEADRIGARLRSGLERLAARFDIIGDIRGHGAMIAIELVESGTAATSKLPHPDAVPRLTAFAAQHGVLFLSAGTFGNVLRFLPSLAMTDELIDDALVVLDDAFSSLA
ncbi:4-aminobutyrate aminotransferase-like enzyme [Agromyces atrinae]|uniref:4-aminobutyrate aminotransferase-like enzyme n=1 Tax=Agromyces atrinae TaxID=592376 RepID=A0A852SEB7_9MICO|nr:4-aminobutyrate aminotransferase-like enzyme [Agromyces atrinae]